MAFAMPLGRIVDAAFIAALVGYVYIAFRQEKASAPAGHGAVCDKSLALQETDAALAPPAPPQKSLMVSARALGVTTDNPRTGRRVVQFLPGITFPRDH